MNFYIPEYASRCAGRDSDRDSQESSELSGMGEAAMNDRLSDPERLAIIEEQARRNDKEHDTLRRSLDDLADSVRALTKSNATLEAAIAAENARRQVLTTIGAYVLTALGGGTMTILGFLFGQDVSAWAHGVLHAGSASAGK